MIVYDAHSHIGIDSFHPLEGRIGDYFSLAKRNGVVIANIMAVPSPVYKIGGIEKQPLFWEVSGNTFSYYSREKVGGNWIIKSKNPANPYREYNNLLEDFLKGITQPNLKFVPLMHPLLDTPEQLEEVVSKGPIAIKIHGIACGIIPEEVPSHILEIIGKSSIPIIVHTDNAPPSFKGPIDYLRRC
ncbi:MAG: hypothetical protein NT076_05850, partial [Candidatus Pacearchaeota archaeon]|nr:hypothetical protein [Candidatus Pacearchaeota archaeon]